jgi:hypothetical protein
MVDLDFFVLIIELEHIGRENLETGISAAFSRSASI